MLEPWILIEAAVRSGLRRLLRAGLRRMRADGVDDEAMAQYMAKAAVEAIEQRSRCGDSFAGLGVIMPNGRTKPLAGLCMRALEDLMEAGMDVRRMIGAVKVANQRRPTGLIHFACQLGDWEVAGWLVERGCDPLEHDSDGNMRHYCAAQKGLTSFLARFLACFNIDVDAEKRGANVGQTAPFEAVERGHFDTVKWRVQNGTDTLREATSPDGEKWRASEVAENVGHHTIAKFQVSVAAGAGCRVCGPPAGGGGARGGRGGGGGGPHGG